MLPSWLPHAQVRRSRHPGREVKNAARIAQERRFRERLKRSAARRMKALEFYEAGNGRTLYDVAAEFDCCATYAGQMVRRARIDRLWKERQEARQSSSSSVPS